MAETVEERVKRVFAEFKKVPVEEITMDTTFEELGFDSLDGLNLVFELEEEFDLTVPDDKVQEMRSVRQAVEGIEMLVAAKEQGIDVAAVAAEEFAAKQAEFRKQKEAKAAGKTKKTEDAPTETADAAPVEAEAEVPNDALADADEETVKASADNLEPADDDSSETKADDAKKKRRSK